MSYKVTVDKTYFSDWPTKGVRMSPTVTQHNLAFASYANAWTSWVFPVPGGPNKSILLNAFLLANNCGWLLGNMTSDFKTFFNSHNPAIFFKPSTFGSSEMLLISFSCSTLTRFCTLHDFSPKTIWCSLENLEKLSSIICVTLMICCFNWYKSS